MSRATWLVVVLVALVAAGCGEPSPGPYQGPPGASGSSAATTPAPDGDGSP